MLESRQLQRPPTTDRRDKKRRNSSLLAELWPEETGIDVSDIDPRAPTRHRPGSFEKVRVLHARYVTGAPLWHPDDHRDREHSGFALSMPSEFGRAPDDPLTTALVPASSTTKLNNWAGYDQTDCDDSDDMD